jgi:hypothetical protein
MVRELPSEFCAVGENGWEMVGFDYVAARGSKNDEIVCIFKKAYAFDQLRTRHC